MTVLETKIKIVDRVVFRQVPGSRLKQELDWLKQDLQYRDNITGTRPGEEVIELFDQLHERDVKDFYVPIIAPSFDKENLLCFVEENYPGYTNYDGFRLNFGGGGDFSSDWMKVPKSPHLKMKLRMATRSEYYALIFNLVYEMRQSGYTTEEAWRTILRWRYTDKDCLTGGGKDVCGWRDLTKWGWCFVDDDDPKFFWKAGWCDGMHNRACCFRSMVTSEKYHIGCTVKGDCLGLLVLDE